MTRPRLHLLLLAATAMAVAPTAAWAGEGEAESDDVRLSGQGEEIHLLHAQSEGGRPTPSGMESPHPAPNAERPFPPLARTGVELLALLLAGGATIAGGEALRRRNAADALTLA